MRLYTADMIARSTVFPLFVFGLLVLSLTLPTPASAHGSGLTLTSTSTNYLVDVDYSDFTIVAGYAGRFDFKLFTDAARLKPAEFTKAWVRIVKESEITEGDTVFSGWIAKAAFGSTGFSIALPDPGSYHMIVRYNNGDDEIIEATLPFAVDPPYQQKRWFDRDFAIGFAAAAAIGVVLAILKRRFTPRLR